jgi:hypothetical protein
MEKAKKCIHPDCSERALSLTEFCWRHIEDEEAYRQKLCTHIEQKNSIKGFYLRRLVFPDAQWQNIDAQEVDLAGADLSGADLAAADLRKANFTGADLSGANLASADLEEAHFLKCDLSNARLWHAFMSGINLAEANLERADLLKAVLTNAKLWHVNLENVKFLTKHSFTGKTPIDEKGAISASEAYRNLKQYFIAHGRYDDSSWASFKEKQLERKYLFENKKIAYLPSLLMAILCGYGEKPYRVIISSISIVFIYSLIYGLLNALNIPEGSNLLSLKAWDYIYFSIVTFTTLGFGDLTPKMIPLFQMLTGSEAFIGAFMMGLFVFTLARKYTAR